MTSFTRIDGALLKRARTETHSQDLFGALPSELKLRVLQYLPPANAAPALETARHMWALKTPLLQERWEGFGREMNLILNNIFFNQIPEDIQRDIAEIVGEQAPTTTYECELLWRQLQDKLIQILAAIPESQIPQNIPGLSDLTGTWQDSVAIIHACREARALGYTTSFEALICYLICSNCPQSACALLLEPQSEGDLIDLDVNNLDCDPVDSIISDVLAAQKTPWRDDAAIKFARGLPDAMQSQAIIHIAIVLEDPVIAQSIPDVWERFDCLIDIGCEELAEALIEGMQNEDDQSQMLSRLSSEIKGFEYAQRLAGRIPNEEMRKVALYKCVPLKAAEEIAATITDPEQRSAAFLQISRYYGKSDRDSAVRAAGQIQDLRMRSLALGHVNPHEGIEVALQIPDADEQSAALFDLIERCCCGRVENLQIGAGAALVIHDLELRSKALQRLSERYCANKHWDLAQNAILHIPIETIKSQALYALIKELCKASGTDLARTIAWTIPTRLEQLQACVILASTLSPISSQQAEPFICCIVSGLCLLNDREREKLIDYILWEQHVTSLQDCILSRCQDQTIKSQILRKSLRLQLTRQLCSSKNEVTAKAQAWRFEQASLTIEAMKTQISDLTERSAAFYNVITAYLLRKQLFNPEWALRIADAIPDVEVRNKAQARIRYVRQYHRFLASEI